MTNQKVKTLLKIIKTLSKKIKNTVEVLKNVELELFNMCGVIILILCILQSL